LPETGVSRKCPAFKDRENGSFDDTMPREYADEESLCVEELITGSSVTNRDTLATVSFRERD